MSAHPSPRRDDAGRTLVSRHVVAYLTHRHLDHVRKRVPAVACDVRTRAALVDLDQAEQLLTGRARRKSRATRDTPDTPTAGYLTITQR